MSAEGLAAGIRRGVEALKAGRADEAAQALQTVAGDPEFDAAPDLDDVRARVWCLLAQALHQAGHSKQAEPWARKALAAAEAQGDRAGADEVRALHRAIFAAVTEAAKAERALADARKLAATALADLLGGDLGTLVAKANAEVDALRPEDGAEVALLALERARREGDLRHEVLALMVLARARPGEASAHLHAAWSVADAADEFNLVGAVARAAELAGIELAVVEGPGGSKA